MPQKGPGPGMVNTPREDLTRAWACLQVLGRGSARTTCPPRVLAVRHPRRRRPGTPNAQQRATLASVSAKSGAAFDSAWIASQITGHRAALAATDKEIANGSDATVLKLAKASRPIIAKHYNELTSGSGSPTGVGAG